MFKNELEGAFVNEDCYTPTKIFDTHIHLNTDLNSDLEAIGYVKEVCLCGITENECHRSDLDQILMGYVNKMVGVGEIGMDGAKDRRDTLDWQEEVFAAQVSFADQYNLPIIVHSRYAGKRVTQVLKESPIQRIILHNFTDKYSYVRDLVEDDARSVLFSIQPGFSNSKGMSKLIRRLGLERIILESDYPYIQTRFDSLAGTIIELANFFEIDRFTVEETVGIMSVSVLSEHISLCLTSIDVVNARIDDMHLLLVQDSVKEELTSSEPIILGYSSTDSTFKLFFELFENDRLLGNGVLDVSQRNPCVFNHELLISHALGANIVIKVNIMVHISFAVQRSNIQRQHSWALLKQMTNIKADMVSPNTKSTLTKSVFDSENEVDDKRISEVRDLEIRFDVMERNISAVRLVFIGEYYSNIGNQLESQFAFSNFALLLDEDFMNVHEETVLMVFKYLEPYIVEKTLAIMSFLYEFSLYVRETNVFNVDLLKTYDEFSIASFITEKERITPPDQCIFPLIILQQLHQCVHVYFNNIKLGILRFYVNCELIISKEQDIVHELLLVTLLRKHLFPLLVLYRDRNLSLILKFQLQLSMVMTDLEEKVSQFHVFCDYMADFKRICTVLSLENPLNLDLTVIENEKLRNTLNNHLLVEK
ncbi:hypothetical protein PCE1_001042 [Barthelona sp. PCE]